MFLFKLFYGCAIFSLCCLSASAQPKSVTVALPNMREDAFALQFVLIDAGSFAMGSTAEDPNAGNEEFPQHTVVISNSFYFGKYEVTNAQFASFLNAKGNISAEGSVYLDPKGLSRQIDLVNNVWVAYRGYENYPAVEVTWYGARDFCQWINEVYPGSGCRLPTEAEWEYACRAGSAGWRYWGDDKEGTMACSYENIFEISFDCKDYFSESCPVGLFLPNDFGLHDMLGNVSEWCGDWYDSDYYARSPRENPVNTKESIVKVLRGGSWLDPASKVRCAQRTPGGPEFSTGLYGFRATASSPKNGVSQWFVY
ncbi:MAG: formylglycine-generating enzyme family protein [bacterium]